MNKKVLSVITNICLLKNYIDVNIKLLNVDKGGRAYKRLMSEEQEQRKEILRRMGEE